MSIDFISRDAPLEVDRALAFFLVMGFFFFAMLIHHTVRIVLIHMMDVMKIDMAKAIFQTSKW